MIPLALVKYSLHAIWMRKTRSLLTIISVLIGITAITALVSFGYGISSYVEEISQEMGDDKLIIQPRGSGFGPPSTDSNVRLDDSDLDTIEDVNGVEEATGLYFDSAEVEFRDEKKFVFISGANYKDHEKLVEEVYSLNILDGKALRGNEKTKAFLGYNYLVGDKIFSKPVKLRDKISVNGQEVKVAGFYEEVGNPTDDANIYMTDTAVEELFNKDNFQFILVRSSPGTDPLTLTDTIAEELRDHRGQTKGNQDFFVQTFDQVIASFTSILNVITAVVILIAFISLFVAAVNIMNTMYTSILERTKEIGIFKAIGSRNNDILFVFIFEAGLLSLLGGVLGVLFGYLIAKQAGETIAAAGFAVFSPVFTWQLVVGSLVFALFVGVISGFLPARRASRLKPVDALRYE